MISLHYSHIAARKGAYFFFLKNSFSFVNFKFSWIFACEPIPAMGAPAASIDLLPLLPNCFDELFGQKFGHLAKVLLHESCEKAADAYTMASSIWDILNYFASSPWQIPLRSAIPVEDSAVELQK
jgi:hypothetical protein